MTEKKVDMSKNNKEAIGTFCDQLGKTITELKEVLLDEMKMLQNHKHEELSTLRERKSMATNAFIMGYHQFDKHANHYKKAYPKKIKELNKKIKELNEVIEENRLMLEAAMSISESLIRQIVEIANKDLSGPKVYGAKAQQAHRKSLGSVAVALDHKT